MDMTQLEASGGERQPGQARPGEPQHSEPQHSEPQPGEPQPGEPQPGEPQPGGLTLDAARFFAARLAASWVPGYLTGRGFGEQALRPWTVGYAPAGWRALIAYLRGLGYGYAVIQA